MTHPLHVAVEAAALDVRAAARRYHAILPRSTEHYHPDGQPMLAPYSLVTGHLIDLFAPNFSRVPVQDLIHVAGVGLARMCRYGAQVPTFYSVAQHCLLGLRLVDEVVDAVVDPVASAKLIQKVERAGFTLLTEQGRGFIAAKQLVALHYLLHDVSEGLGLMDIPNPLKRLIAPIYGPLEDRMMAAFYRRIQLEPPGPEVSKLVKQIDVLMLHEEQSQLRSRAVPADFKPHNWGGRLHDGEDNDNIETTERAWVRELCLQLNNLPRRSIRL